MALNPLRAALGSAGLRASGEPSPFRSEAEAALAGFRSYRADLERQVRRGDLTPKVARQQAAAAAATLRDRLSQASSGYSPVPSAFLERLGEASRARQKSRDSLSLEGLQRETNRLLRQSLIEQQLQTRLPEFEGRAYARPMAGGPPVPTLDSLLTFHESARVSGDETALEWGRRQLEGFRSRVLNPEDQRRIDRACDRPDRINPRVVATYVEAMQGRDPADLETYVSQALESHDANACTAAFLLARQSPEGASLRWVRSVLDGLKAFPDAALEALRTLEADARRLEAEAAQSQAEYMAALAESEARLPGVEAPSRAELDRQSRHQSKPVAQLGEPIGLALDRRGLTPQVPDSSAYPARSVTPSADPASVFAPSDQEG